MQVFILKIGSDSSYSYSGTEWNVDKVFDSMDSAQKYIKSKQDSMSPRDYSDLEFYIEVFDVEVYNG